MTLEAEMMPQQAMRCCSTKEERKSATRQIQQQPHKDLKVAFVVDFDDTIIEIELVYEKEHLFLKLPDHPKYNPIMVRILKYLAQTPEALYILTGRHPMLAEEIEQLVLDITTQGFLGKKKVIKAICRDFYLSSLEIKRANSGPEEDAKYMAIVRDWKIRKLNAIREDYDLVFFWDDLAKNIDVSKLHLGIQLRDHHNNIVYPVGETVNNCFQPMSHLLNLMTL